MSLSILLVNPPTPGARKFTRNIGCAAESKGSYLLKSVDFLTLSGGLSSIGHVKLLDFVSKNASKEACLDQICQEAPNIIVMSMIDVIFDNDLEFLKELYDKNLDSRIYVLGDAFIETQNVSQVERYVEGIIAEPFLLNPLELKVHQKGFPIEGLRHEKSFARNNKGPQQRELDVPRHELFDDLFYQWPFAKHSRYTCITTVWGCPYSCSYCTAARFPVHYRPYTNVIEEMEYVSSLGFKEVYITDLSFGLPYDNVMNLLQEMVKKKYGFSWSTYFHPQQYRPELLDLMYKAGCHTIITGVETSDEDILKGYGRSSTHKKTVELLQHAHRLGIEVCGDFLIGLKEQSERELIRNIDFAIELNLDYASFNLVAPLPGTSLREEAVKKGVVNNIGHGVDSLGTSEILSLGGVPSSQLWKIRNRSLVKFYLRPSYILRKLFSRGSFFRVWLQGVNFITMFTKALKIRRSNAKRKGQA